MIRVLVADDETLVRTGIRTLLERVPEVEVVAEAGDGEEALARLGEGVDVGLLDVRMPRRGGIEVLQALAGWAQAPACLLLTTFDDREPLTPRETGVMRFVAGGYSNREIGEALGAAEGTVKVHVSSILSKLGVRDRVQAVLRALEAGLI